jgi:hypothetical protein
MDGEDGVDGSPGTPGATGATGPTGPAGSGSGVSAPGAPGQDGEDGLDGFPGPAGPMGGSLIETLVDLGSTMPVWEKTFTVADSQATAGTAILAQVLAKATTSHQADELEMDQPTISAYCLTAGTVTMSLKANDKTGPVYGVYAIGWTKTAALQARDTDFGMIFMLMGG